MKARVVRVDGTGWRWVVEPDGAVGLELQVGGDEWQRRALFGRVSLAVVCAAGVRVAADMAEHRAPERGGGAVLEG